MRTNKASDQPPIRGKYYFLEHDVSILRTKVSYTLNRETFDLFISTIYILSYSWFIVFSPKSNFEFKNIRYNNQCTVWPSSNLLQNSIILQCSTVLSSTAVFQALHFYQVLKFYRVVLKRFYDLAKLCTSYSKLYYCQGTAW